MPRASSNKLVLLIVKDVPPISVPGDVARDLCRTVLENALRYSENGRDVVCEVTKDSNFVVLETRSVPKAKCWPVRKPNHGLARLSDTLIDFGGWLRLPEFGGDMATHCVVTMGLPIKWSLK